MASGKTIRTERRKDRRRLRGLPVNDGVKGLGRHERESLYRRLVTRDGPGCGICGETVFDLDRSLDHIIPKCEGGTDEWWNLRIAHRACNSARESSGR